MANINGINAGLVLTNVAGATTIANMTCGLVPATSGQTWIGNNGTGVLNLSGGTLTTNNWLALGRASSHRLRRSQPQRQRGRDPCRERRQRGDGRRRRQRQRDHQSVGQLDLRPTLYNQVQIGPSGWGLYTISGGTGNFLATTLGNLKPPMASGILTVSGSATVNATTVTLGGATNGSGIVNLNGGLLAATQLAATGTGTTAFNLNGGTLQAAPGAAGELHHRPEQHQCLFRRGRHQYQRPEHRYFAKPGHARRQRLAVDQRSAARVTWPRRPSRSPAAAAAAPRPRPTIDGNGNITGITITNPGTGYTSARRRRSPWSAATAS